MPAAGDRSELRDALDQPQDDRLQDGHARPSGREARRVYPEAGSVPGEGDGDGVALASGPRATSASVPVAVRLEQLTRGRGVDVEGDHGPCIAERVLRRVDAQHAKVLADEHRVNGRAPPNVAKTSTRSAVVSPWGTDANPAVTTRRPGPTLPASMLRPSREIG